MSKTIKEILALEIFVLASMLAFVIYRQIVYREETERAFISPRFPIPATVTQAEFDNGEESTIHVIPSEEASQEVEK